MCTYIDDLLTERATAAPNSALLEHDGRRWTSMQVELLADRGAHWLVQSGVREGDRVLILGENSDGFVVAVLAALRAGAVVVPISPRLAVSMLTAIVTACSPSAVFADAAAMSAYAAGLHNMVRREFSELLTDRADHGVVRVERRTNLACIIFTSGSAGTARGVACTHSAILVAIRSINTTLDMRDEDRIFCVLPFSFDYGLYQVFLAMDCGATVVIASTTTTVANLPRLLHTHAITVLPIVPALSVMLLRSGMLERLRLPSLRLVTNTGDMLPMSHQIRMHGLLPETAIVPMYGLTECKRVAILPPHILEEAPHGSVGLPLPSTVVSLRPLPEAGRCTAEWGELLIQGPQLMAGYWEDPSATRERFPSDPVTGTRTLRSGDVFTRDGKGFLTYLGRVESIGHRRGHWMFSAPLEDKLADLPGVDQAAVIFTKQVFETTGIMVYLCMQQYYESIERLARTMIADMYSNLLNIEIRCLPKFPYTLNGKIDRVALSRVGSS